MKKAALNIFVITVVMLFVVFGFDCNIRKPVAPVWDLEINFPLINHPYTIDSLIRKDTSLIQKDPINGFLTYSYTQSTEFDSVGDRIQIKPKAPSPKSISAGSIPFSNIPEISTKIPNPGIPSGIIPPGNLPPLFYNMPANDQFDYLEFESGTVILNITNHLPVTIHFNNPVTFFDSENNIIGPFFIDSLIQGQTKSSGTDLTDKRIKNQLSLDTVLLSTPGSPVPVTIPDSILGISLSFQNLMIRSARARIPPTPILKIDSTEFVMDTSAVATKLKIARLKKGAITLKVKNDFDLLVEVSLMLPQLVNKVTGQSFYEVRNIVRGDSIQIRLDLKNTYEFRSDVPTNRFIYSASFKQLGSIGDTLEFRTFRNTDAIVISGEIDPPPDNVFILQYVEGIVKPTEVNFDTLLNVDLGELPSKFSADSLRLPDSKLTFKLYSPGIQSSFGGSIWLDSIPDYSITIPTTLLIPQDTTTLILSGNDVVSVLTRYVGAKKKLPGSFYVNGNGIINPNYVLGSVSSSDRIDGRVVFDIPANIGLKGGVFRDTLEINGSDNGDGQINLDSAKIENIQSGTLTFDIANGIPIGSQISFKLYDADSTFLQYIPSDGSKLISSSQVGTDGFASTAVQSKFTVPLNKGEINNINKAKYVVLEIYLNTPPAAPSVKFRSTDLMKVRIFGTFKYRTDF